MEPKNHCVSCQAKLGLTQMATLILFNFYTCGSCKKRVVVKYRWEIMLGALIGGILGGLIAPRYPEVSSIMIGVICFLATFLVLGLFSYLFGKGTYSVKSK